MTHCRECDLPILQETHQTAADLTVHPWCCPDCNGPELLARHQLPYPAGTAVIVTSRPAPGAHWQTTVHAPGLDLDGCTHETRWLENARYFHNQAVNTARMQIAMIPTIRKSSA